MTANVTSALSSAPPAPEGTLTVAVTVWFTPATLVTFPHAQDLDREGLVGRAVSASFVPKQGAAFLALRERLDALFDRHRDARGRVRMRYVTKLYRAQRR